MKLGVSLALCALASCAASPSQTPTPVPPPTPGHENAVSVYLGQRALDDEDYDPVDKQPTLGIEYSREEIESAVGFEVGFMASSDDDDGGGFDAEGATAEIYGGVRKTFGRDVVRPYVGGGLTLIAARVEAGGNDEDDGSLGAYAHGGVAFHVTDKFFFGIDLRGVFGTDLEFSGFETDADYGQLAVVLGVTF